MFSRSSSCSKAPVPCKSIISCGALFEPECEAVNSHEHLMSSSSLVIHFFHPIMAHLSFLLLMASCRVLVQRGGDVILHAHVTM